MQFTVHAQGSGKRVRVVDRIGGVDAFNAFLDPDATAAVTVASSDGQTGDIDLLVQMRADGAWTSVESDYEVAADSVYDVEDV